MSTEISPVAHRDQIKRAAVLLATAAHHAGLERPVPTCPGWVVRDLIAHQGMVHRWATSVIAQDRVFDQAEVEREGRSHSDPSAWFTEGANRLLGVLQDAPADLEVKFFLRGAKTPLAGWTRRQCHETTIHAVDAVAARLGRVPSAELITDTGVEPALAADGVDELLCGFATRPRRGVQAGEPFEVLVRATDTGDSWHLVVPTDAPAQCRRDAQAHDRIPTWSGTAEQLYLGLWNRGEDITEAGGAGATLSSSLLAQWRERMRVEWE